MIKNYKQFESLLNKLEGPTEDEIWNTIKNKSPEDIMIKSVKGDYIKGVEYAKRNGVDIHIQNEAFLRKACEHGSYKVVKYLIEQGAYININDEEPLRNAVYENHYNVVKVLLENGAEVNSYGGHLAINNATKLGKIQILNLLSDKLNPNIDVLDLIDYNDANDLLNKSVGIDFTRGIKKAIDEGANLKIGDYIALKYGILNNNYIAVKYILDNYDVKIKGNIDMYTSGANQNMKNILKNKLGI